MPHGWQGFVFMPAYRACENSGHAPCETESAGKRRRGRTACLTARLRGIRPAEFRRLGRRNVRRLAPYTNPAGLPASPGSVYRKSFFSPEDLIKKETFQGLFTASVRCAYTCIKCHVNTAYTTRSPFSESIT